MKRLIGILIMVQAILTYIIATAIQTKFCFGLLL
jgi:hypothetical protein